MGHSRAACSRFDNTPGKFYLPSVPVTPDALFQDPLALPPDQRAALAHRLLASVEPDPEPGAEDAWEAEIARRIAWFDSGESVTVPADEVFARLWQIAQERSA